MVLGLLDRESLDAAGIRQGRSSLIFRLPAGGVLIGLVDTGTDYTHPAFIYEDGTTKIVSIYDMSDTHRASAAGIFIGTEYKREQINEALRADDLYSIEAQRDTSGHGNLSLALHHGKAGSAVNT